MLGTALILLSVLLFLGAPCLLLGWAFAKTLEWMDTNPDDRSAHK